MADDSLHIHDLLVKHLIGETDAEEQALVEEWLEASVENKEEYAQMQAVWQNSLSVSTTKVNTDAAWAKVSARIDILEEQDNVQPQPVVRTLKKPKWSWVAAAVLLALVGLFSIFQYHKVQPVTIQASDMLVQRSLPDGSSVALNAHSQLKYAKNFDGETREVKLRGEAFFDVQPNAAKPFIIDAGLGQVTVLGTSFNVEAHDGEDIEVHVVEGRVQLSMPKGHADTSLVILQKGETGFINRATQRVYKESPVYDDALFWLNKKLAFTKTPLPKVFKVLEKNYKLSFSNYDAGIEKCLLTARFEKESLESILQVISATFNIEFIVDGETVMIKSQENNCAEG